MAKQLSKTIAASQVLKLEALQSLRGIAAVIVLLRHSLLSYQIHSDLINVLIATLLNSHAAVVVFFVLSGFVLGLSLDSRQLSSRSIAGFYIKRSFRVLPCLMFVTIISIWYTLLPYSSISVTGGSPFFGGLLQHGPLKPSVVIRSLFGLNSHYVPQNWTVMVELLIAPIFPFLFFLVRRSGWGFAIMLGITIIASFAARTGGHWLPVVYAVDFLIGIGVFLYWSRKIWPERNRLPLIALVALPILIAVRPASIIMGVGLVNPNNFHDPASGLIEAIASGVIILALAGNAPLGRLFSGRILVFIGNISFSLYLVHFLVIVILARVFDKLVPHFNDLSGFDRCGILSISVLAVSVVISSILYQIVEMPSNQLGRRLAFFDVASPDRIPPRGVGADSDASWPGVPI